MFMDFDVRGQQGMEYFTGRSIIMDNVHIFWPEAIVLSQKHLNDELVYNKHATFLFTRH